MYSQLKSGQARNPEVAAGGNAESRSPLRRCPFASHPSPVDLKQVIPAIATETGSFVLSDFGRPAADRSRFPLFGLSHAVDLIAEPPVPRRIQAAHVEIASPILDPVCIIDREK